MSANSRQVGGDHYKKKKIQHWDYVTANEMPYLDALAFKYIDRHAEKGGRQDLDKAIHTIQKMIEVYYPDKVVDPSPVYRTGRYVEENGVVRRQGDIIEGAEEPGTAYVGQG